MGHSHPENLAYCVNRNLIKFRRKRCRFQNLGQNNPVRWSRLGSSWLSGSLSERGVTANARLNLSQLCALIIKEEPMLGCIGKSVIRRLREAVNPL